MVDYSIRFVKSAGKELERLPRSVIKRVLSKIEELSREPRPHGSRKLHGEKNLWRVRVGDYRVVYAILDGEKAIEIMIVRHRSNVYDLM